ncbi:MAG: transposase, partial [Chloroflexi bacterium]|nr:transposase [Chloroflexota bacterium]
QILSKLKALGLIRDRGKMRTDSTHILGVLHRLSQLELITECMRVALQAALAAAPKWCERELPQAFQEAYAQRQWQFGLRDAEVKAKCAVAAKDGFWFLHVVDTASPKVVRKLPEVATLRTVLSQQFPDGPDGPPAKRPMGSDVIETPHEREARCATKRGQTWTGYKAQVTETCDDDRPRFIVDLEVTGALDNDSPQLNQIQARLQQQGTLPSEQQVDQGYMSAENLVQSAQLGINLMGMPLDDTRGAPGFRQSDFRIDPAAQTAICPAGHKSSVWAQRTTPSDRPAPTLVRFDASTCRACQCFGRCTSSSQGRSLTLHPYRSVLLARRAEAITPAFQMRLHARAGIEATISELVRKHGLRSARYRGKAKVRLQAYFTATAANLKRAARWMTTQSDLLPSLSLC